jgi:tripeptide aminopeptidase
VKIQGLKCSSGICQGEDEECDFDWEWSWNGLLPVNQKPEFTQDYEGFFHIIHFEVTVENAKFSYIIRDHDRKLFEQKKQVMMDCVEVHQ